MTTQNSFDSSEPFANKTTPIVVALQSQLCGFADALRCDAHPALAELSPNLDRLRATVSKGEWDRFCSDCVQRHEICSILLQDPFTKHAFDRPRGYPGDADLLDWVYSYKPLDGISSVGARVHSYAINVQSCQAVRERRTILAQCIDEVAIQFTNPRIVALAAGHLREADLSSTIKSRRIGELIAFDQDASSLATIHADYGNHQIQTQQESVRSIIAGKHSFRDFHFVYAAGLFDYLSDRVATRLVGRMFDMLLPGGRLLVANFAPILKDIGYMEAFMRWHLIYRNEQEMASLSAGIDSSRIANQRIYWDSNKCMLFFEVERA